MPHLDQSDEEVAALIQHLKQAIDSDRYALSPPLVPLKAVLAKLRAPVDLQTPAAAQVLRAAASNSCQKALSGPVEAKFGPGSIPRAGSAYDSLPGKLLPPQAVIGVSTGTPLQKTGKSKLPGGKPVISNWGVILRATK